MAERKKDPASLRKLIAAHREWLLVRGSGRTFPLRSDEMEFDALGCRTLFSFITDRGFRTRRVSAASVREGRITLELSGDFGRERERIELVPRTDAAELGAEVELARLGEAERLASLLADETPGTRLERVELNRDGGRLARILFTDRTGRRRAALADVSGSLDPETLLSAAVTWLAGLRRRKKSPVGELWILVEKRKAGGLRRLHACLRGEEFSEDLRIRTVEDPAAVPAEKKGDSGKRIADPGPLALSDLWADRAPRPKRLPRRPGRIAREIIELAPGRIDHLFAEGGETLRYRGLPFVRVRRTAGAERAWFGTGPERRILDRRARAEFRRLLGTLAEYRRHDSPNKRHAFYRDAPEAWLESLLRRDIRALDADLLPAPVHDQYRAARERIDLLALRRDGRLAIIEVKVAPDRNMLFQAVDYWRRVELRRRRGMLAKANLFRGRRIADRPALVYLAAPALAFHRQFDLLARAVSPEVPVFRFDLNEDWRAGVRVTGRRQVT